MRSWASVVGFSVRIAAFRESKPVLEFDPQHIRSFEDQLDPVHPETGTIRAQVIGYGEISCVLQISPYHDLVFKRMAGFDSLEQVEAYRDVIVDYCRILSEAGIGAAETGFVDFKSRHGGYVLYLVQPKLPHDELGNVRLAELEGERLQRLVRDTMEALAALWTRNQKTAPGEVIGLDGQISNWAYSEVGEGFQLTYFDVGTPFIRRGGREQLDGSVHMNAMPFFLRPVVRRLFMSDVLDRYYDLRSVLIDYLANFVKEGFPGKIDPSLVTINAYLAEDAAHLDIAPIERAEIEKYYKEDAFIWTVFLAFRRFDRFLTRRVLRRRYDYILPGYIRR